MRNKTNDGRIVKIDMSQRAPPRLGQDCTRAFMSASSLYATRRRGGFGVAARGGRGQGDEGSVAARTAVAAATATAMAVTSAATAPSSPPRGELRAKSLVTSGPALLARVVPWLLGVLLLCFVYRVGREACAVEALSNIEILQCQYETIDRSLLSTTRNPWVCRGVPVTSGASGEPLLSSEALTALGRLRPTTVMMPVPAAPSVQMDEESRPVGETTRCAVGRLLLVLCVDGTGVVDLFHPEHSDEDPLLAVRLRRGDALRCPPRWSYRVRPGADGDSPQASFRTIHSHCPIGRLVHGVLDRAIG